ncbi:hypothetical protein FB451DRAFT_1374550 [Mycena latifolia]|nr:hypothetical protein FB451DRAFT_1374550 [Mycena latifolia]
METEMERGRRSGLVCPPRRLIVLLPGDAVRYVPAMPRRTKIDCDCRCPDSTAPLSQLRMAFVQIRPWRSAMNHQPARPPLLDPSIPVPLRLKLKPNAQHAKINQSTATGFFRRFKFKLSRDGIYWIILDVGLGCDIFWLREDEEDGAEPDQRPCTENGNDAREKHIMLRGWEIQGAPYAGQGEIASEARSAQLCLFLRALVLDGKNGRAWAYAWSRPSGLVGAPRRSSNCFSFSRMRHVPRWSPYVAADDSPRHDGDCGGVGGLCSAPYYYYYPATLLKLWRAAPTQTRHTVLRIVSEKSKYFNARGGPTSASTSTSIKFQRGAQNGRRLPPLMSRPFCRRQMEEPLSAFGRHDTYVPGRYAYPAADDNPDIMATQVSEVSAVVGACGAPCAPFSVKFQCSRAASPVYRFKKPILALAPALENRDLQRQMHVWHQSHIFSSQHSHRPFGWLNALGEVSARYSSETRLHVPLVPNTGALDKGTDTEVFVVFGRTRARCPLFSTRNTAGVLQLAREGVRASLRVCMPWDLAHVSERTDERAETETSGLRARTNGLRTAARDGTGTSAAGEERAPGLEGRGGARGTDADAETATLARQRSRPRRQARGGAGDGAVGARGRRTLHTPAAASRHETRPETRPLSLRKSDMICTPTRAAPPRRPQKRKRARTGDGGGRHVLVLIHQPENNAKKTQNKTEECECGAVWRCGARYSARAIDGGAAILVKWPAPEPRLTPTVRVPVPEHPWRHTHCPEIWIAITSNNVARGRVNYNFTSTAEKIPMPNSRDECKASRTRRGIKEENAMRCISPSRGR